MGPRVGQLPRWGRREVNRSEKDSGSTVLVRVRYKGEGEREARETPRFLSDLSS